MNELRKGSPFGFSTHKGLIGNRNARHRKYLKYKEQKKLKKKYERITLYGKSIWKQTTTSL